MFDSQKNPVFRARLATIAPSTFGYMLAVGVALVAALFALMVFSGTRVGADLGPDLYLLPDDALYPEGIATENNGDTFYVSSFADGSIYRGNLAEEKVKHFLPGRKDGRTQAVGMALDDERRLYIAGGFYNSSESPGKVFIYDTTSRKLVRTFSTQSSEGLGFLNDVTVDPKTGDAYITDSFVANLWRVPAEKVTNSPQPGELELVRLTGTPIEIKEGFNLNGIVATQNGPFLLTVQSNTGNLYRIDTTKSNEVTQVDLGGATLTNGDGLVLNDHTLYVVRNQDELIAKVLLTRQFASGQVKETVRDSTFDFPTTAALADGRLLVVNSQFDEGGPVCPDVKVCPEGEPEIPFKVSSIQAP